MGAKTNVRGYIDSKIGLIRVFSKDELELISKESVSINDIKIEVGDKTTLNDFFSAEVVYLGVYKDYMQFQVGEDCDLFESIIFTNEFKKIDENRIMTIHKLGTARDYIYLNNKWK